MEYRNIYFRLDAGYKWGRGAEEDIIKAFHAEITQLFQNAGWTIKESKYASSCPTVTKDKNSLYLHPMEASGELQEDMIDDVKNILSKGTTFNHFRTDVYEVLQDMPDNEYIRWLDERKDSIERELLAGFTTKRRNLVITQSSAVIEKVKEKYHLPRIQSHIGRSSSDVEWKYVTDIFIRLVDDKRIAEAKTKHGTGYRTVA